MKVIYKGKSAWLQYVIIAVSILGCIFIPTPLFKDAEGKNESLFKKFFPKKK